MTVHLHTVIVSWRRLGLTLETVDSWLATVTVPATIVVVDNASPEDPTPHLAERGVPCVRLDRNYYPGFAANHGWMYAPSGTTWLQRSDNDVRYLPGWCEQMLAAFDDPKVGQWGPIAAGDEQWAQLKDWPIGGNTVIRHSMWVDGLRYDERPWGPGWAECGDFHARVQASGWERRFSERPCVEWLDDGDREYREETHRARGLDWRPFGAAQ